MSNYSDHQFRQLSHSNCDKDLLWGYAKTADAYRQENRAKDQGMLNEWHSSGRGLNAPSSIDVRKSFSKNRSDESMITRMFSPLAKLFAR